MATKNSYLGVDIGVSGIKVVELDSQHNRPVLLTYGFNNRPAADFGKKLIDDPVAASALLKRICEKAQTVSKRVITSLPISMVFSAVINVPVASEKEMRPAVEVQAAKLSPWPIADIVLDWKAITEGKKNGEKTTPVLVTGAEKTLIKKYLDIFKLAGLEINSLETEAFALMRSLVGEEKGASMILDIGGERTNIVIVMGGVPMVSRSIGLGGRLFTGELSKRLGVGDMEAEELKLDAEKLEVMLGGGNNVLFEMYGALLRPVLNEIKYSMELYASQASEGSPKIEKIILTGGSCLLPGLSAFVSDNFKIRAYIGDPWARTIYSEDLRPLLDKIGPRFAVALGLAMRNISKK